MKNRNIPYYVAALMLAAGVSTSFVSCVDTDEPDSIVTLRNAKAEEVKAQAEVQKALAAYQNAQTELKLAEKAEKAAKAKSAEVEASLKELELAKQKELDVLEIQEAKAFEDESTILFKEFQDFEVNDYMKFTIVIWLDGFDEQNPDGNTEMLGGALKTELLFSISG